MNYRLSIFFVVLLSFLIRSYNLSAPGFWMDEMSSLHFSTHPAWIALTWDNSPILYHVFLKLWFFLAPTTEFWARIPSVVFSTMTTALFAFAGHRISGHKGLWTAGLLHATFGLSVELAREVRPYAMFELFTAILVLTPFLWPTPKNWVLRIGPPLIGIFTHYLMIFPILFRAVSTGFESGWKKREVLFWGFALAVSAMLLTQLQWAGLSWQVKRFAFPDYQLPFRTVLELLGGVFSGLCFATTAAVLTVRRNRPAQMHTAFFVLSFVLIMIAGFIMKRSFFWERYFIFLGPSVILIFTFVESNLTENRLLRLGLYASLACFLGFQSVKVLKVISQTNPPWEQTAVWLSLNSKSKVVYTTRPLSIATPYFDRNGIILKNLKVESGLNYEKLISKAQSGEQIWILENTLGFNYYYGQLNFAAQAAGCKLLDNSIAQESEKKVWLVQLSCESSENAQ